MRIEVSFPAKWGRGRERDRSFSLGSGIRCKKLRNTLKIKLLSGPGRAAFSTKDAFLFAGA